MQGTGDSEAPDTRARDERIKAHLDLVKSIARDVRARPLGRGIESTISLRTARLPRRGGHAVRGAGCAVCCVRPPANFGASSMASAPNTGSAAGPTAAFDLLRRS